MRFLKNIKNKKQKYFKTMFWLMLLAMSVILYTFGAFAYGNIQKKTTEYIENTDAITLEQFRVNYSMMDDSYKSITYALSANPNIAKLMYSSDVTDIEEINLINDITKKIVDVYPFVHSVFIYNFASNKIYSTKSGIYGTQGQAELFYDKLEEIMNLTSYPNELQNNGKGEYVFSYVFKDDFNSNMTSGGALVVNFSVDWFVDNLKSFVNATQAGAQILFLNNNVLYDLKNKEFVENEFLQKDVLKYLKDKNTEGYAFNISEIEGEKYVISYIKLDDANSYIIKYVKYDDAFKDALFIKNIFTVISVFAILVCVLVAYFVSKKLYSPIRELMRQVSQKNNIEVVDYDEFAHLKQYFEKLQTKIEKFETNESSNQRTVKEYYLYSMLLNESANNYQEYKKKNPDYWLFSVKDLSLNILKIKAEYKEVEEKNELKDSLLYLLLQNVSFELFLLEMQSTYIDSLQLNSSEFLIMFNAKDPMYFVKKLKETVENMIDTTLYYSISESISDIREISFQYSKITNNLQYRILNKNEAIITYYKYENNENNNTLSYDEKQDKILADQVAKGKISEAKTTLQIIMSEIASLRYINIMPNLFLLMRNVYSVVENNGANKTNDALILLNTYYNKISVGIYVDEILELLIKMIELTEKDSFLLENQKIALLVNAAKNYVKNNFADVDLYQDKIAEVLGVSGRTLSKKFKDHTNIALSAYIVNVKLEKAAELLVENELSILEVMKRVGIENESYFYRLFKQHFSLTPKEYAMLNKAKKAD